MPQLDDFAAEHGLTFITVAQLVAYRLRTERLVHRVAEARLPTASASSAIIGYRNDVDRAEHVALVYGDVAGPAERAGADALEVPHRRRVPLAALRLRRGSSHAAMRADRARRGAA